MQQLILDWDSPKPEALSSLDAGAGQKVVQQPPVVSAVDEPAAAPAPESVRDAGYALPIGSADSPADASGETALAAPLLSSSEWHAADNSATKEPAASNAIVAAPAWQHPQANRHIVLGQHALGYWLQRRKRRSVGMKIASHGLEVHAPVWVNLAEIERILQSKSRWIVRKLQEQASLRHSQQLTRPQWQDGQYLLWRGGLLQLRLAGAATPIPLARLSSARMQKLVQAARLLDLPASDLGTAHLSQSASASDAGTFTAVIARHQLWLDLPLNSSESLIRDCTACWMQMQAQAVFIDRMAHYAPMLGVQWRALKLSQANTRWGSASSNGTIRLHWRLIQMPPEVLDYVVVHELAHLREMNHSARFWALVEGILPDYRQRQFQLKRTSLPPW
ncbi:MAG: SprT family zinc-dependent metalloprotease [Brachymonas sp.]|nr:SprT family zinc-dependent metalloprotease [Brachymonas sp.]